MKITAIKKQERHDRYNVFADEQFVTAIAANVLASSGLGVGDEIDQSLLDQLNNRDSYSKTLAKAYDYLSRRPHSTGELRRKLSQKEYRPASIEEVIDHLTEIGYLDDASFAKRWVDSRGSVRGPMLLRQELRKKHLATEVIDHVLAEHRAEHSELAEAESLARQRLERLSSQPWQAIYGKLGGYLARRGYSSGIIHPILEKLKAER